MASLSIFLPGSSAINPPISAHSRCVTVITTRGSASFKFLKLIWRLVSLSHHFRIFISAISCPNPFPASIHPFLILPLHRIRTNWTEQITRHIVEAVSECDLSLLLSFIELWLFTRLGRIRWWIKETHYHLFWYRETIAPILAFITLNRSLRRFSSSAVSTSEHVSSPLPLHTSVESWHSGAYDVSSHVSPKAILNLMSSQF